MRRAVTLLALLFAAGGILHPVIVGAWTPDPATGSPPLRLWAAENEASTHTTTLADAIADAQRFGVIVAVKSTYRSYVGPMKTANPSLLLLVYMNGSYVGKNEGSSYPEAWYAHDVNGAKIQSADWGNYLMDVSNPDWIANRARACASLISYSGYDGCMIDMLGLAPLDPGYDTALPIDPATGQAWTGSDWLRGTSSLAAAVRASVGPHLVFGNGFASGPRYFNTSSPTRQLLSGVDGGIAEGWLRTAYAKITAFRSETAWRQDVDMLANAGSAGDSVLVLTKVWSSGTQAQKDAWHKYALASFFLGTDGTSFFSFRYSSTDDPTTVTAWDSIDIGQPLGAYAKVGGVYRRDFTGGLALVNPTKKTYMVALGASYVTLDGTVVTSVTLGPNTGEVLRPA